MNNERLYAMLACQLAISGLILNQPNKHFKIGKTSQNPPQDRYDAEYKEKYSQFYLLYGCADLSLIDYLEVELIKYYKRCYDKSCDNKLPEVGPSLKGPNLGYIYIVME